MQRDQTKGKHNGVIMATRISKEVFEEIAVEVPSLKYHETPRTSQLTDLIAYRERSLCRSLITHILQALQSWYQMMLAVSHLWGK